MFWNHTHTKRLWYPLSHKWCWMLHKRTSLQKLNRPSMTSHFLYRHEENRLFNTWTFFLKRELCTFSLVSHKSSKGNGCSVAKPNPVYGHLWTGDTFSYSSIWIPHYISTRPINIFIYSSFISFIKVKFLYNNVSSCIWSVDVAMTP